MLIMALLVNCDHVSGSAAAHEIDANLSLHFQLIIEQVVETGGDQVLRLELLRRDHPWSPLADGSGTKGKTSGERFVEAVKRSNARRDAIARSMQHMNNYAGVASKPIIYNMPVSAGDGEFITQFALGTPKQMLTFIVDTGSDMVWNQCLPCTQCYNQTGPKFNPKKSSTYKPSKCFLANLCQDIQVTGCFPDAAGCQYIYGYGDGSTTSGNMATETLTLGNASGVPNFGFGCGHDNEGYFSLAGGIAGLGQGPLSLISQLNNMGVVSKKFSYCLVNYNSVNGSPLILGDPAVASAPPGIAYTPIHPNANNPTFYYLDLDGISVAGRAVSYPAGTFAIDSSGNGGLIIDSGTTITYLNTDGYNAVLAAVKADLIYPIVNGSSYGLDLCFNISSASSTTGLNLPTMVFHFTNADFVMEIENLYVFVEATQTILCLAMAGNSGFSILGNIQHQDHLIVYDLSAKFQIGFKSITCG